MSIKFGPENKDNKPEPSEIDGKHFGETWGETTRRVILNKVTESGSDGFPITDLLSALRKNLYTSQGVGEIPEDVNNDAVDYDDVSFTLLDLQKEGLIEIKEGRAYLIKNNS